MPRTYVKKRTVAYDNAHLKIALEDVQKDKPIRAAAKQYGIPFETLRRWICKPPTHIGSGRSTILTQDEEHCIVVALKFLADCGFPFDRHDVMNIAQEYLKLNNKHNNLKLGIEWVRNFEKRWSNHLSKRKPELLTQARAAALSANVVNSFFTTYTKLLNENDLISCPQRIFNLDEVGLSTDPRANKVFVSKQSKNAYLNSSDAGKAMYTVLFCISADGNYMPPFTVYKSVHLYDSWTTGGTQGAIYGCSASGWMEEKIFESWMEHFALYTQNIKKPVLLIFDGHGSHLTYKTVKTAFDNQVIILCLPPNTSHALQPLDVGVFAPAKKSWRLILKQWYRETRLQKVSKAIFPYLLKKLFESLRKDHAVNGFKGAGLFPPDIKEVEHRIVMTERATHQLNLLATPLNTIELQEPTPATADVDAELPSCSSTQDKITPGPTHQLSSPFRDLKCAILSTISPEQSSVTTAALVNSKRKRKRVQCKAGEVMTELEVIERLHEEALERIEKKSKSFELPHGEKKSRSKSTDCKMFKHHIRELLPGKWIKVEYKGKKSIKTFIGQIMHINGNDIHVKYVKKSKLGDYYVFPEKDDVDIIQKTDIISILEEPFCNNREQYHFKI